MTTEDAFAKLSSEKAAALNDEQKAIFLSLSPADQDFFASAFKPGDLPGALTRKGEIMQRNQPERERMTRNLAALREGAAARPPEADAAEDALTGVAMGALGIGAAVAVATDNTARYRGVRPEELVAPLRAEFGSGSTTVDISGRPDALVATVSLLDGGGTVPAMTINLTSVDEGVEVKVNDLTTRGLLESVKKGGMKLLDAAGKGIDLLRGGARSPLDMVDKAGRALTSGTNLFETASNLNLKQRAWKTIKQAAEAIEKNYLSELDEERQERFALEKAWDNHNNCPNCGVSFGPEEAACRVCATARPERPSRSDPRSQ